MQISLLGALRLTAGGTDVEVPGATRRAALAFLALHADEPVRASRMVAALWGDEPPVNARCAARGIVGDLQALLVADPGSQCRVVVSESSYELRTSHVALDLQLFRQLREEGRSCLEAGDVEGARRLLQQALELWRGQPLVDLVCAGGWPELAELREERLALLEDWVDVVLRLGGAHQVIEQLRALVAAEPLRERLSALLMRALAAAGRVEDALVVHREVAVALADEWGIDPGRDLREVRDALAASDATGACRGQRVPSSEDTPTSTLLFALGGQLSSAADPERLAAVLDALGHEIGRQVRESGGRVIPLQGPAVLAVFEAANHAERAVRVALAVRDTFDTAVPGCTAASFGLCAAVASGEVRGSTAGGGAAGPVLTGPAVDGCHRMIGSGRAGMVLVDGAACQATSTVIAYRPWSSSLCHEAIAVGPHRRRTRSLAA